MGVPTYTPYDVNEKIFRLITLGKVKKCFSISVDSLSCDAMGKSFPQSNFGQINVGRADLL